MYAIRSYYVNKMASNSRKTGVLAVATAGVMLLATYMIFFYLPPIKDEAGEVLSRNNFV